MVLWCWVVDSDVKIQGETYHRHRAGSLLKGVGSPIITANWHFICT